MSTAKYPAIWGSVVNLTHGLGFSEPTIAGATIIEYGENVLVPKNNCAGEL